MRQVLPLALVAALAGCDAAPTANTTAAAPAGPSEFQTRFAALDAAGRNIVFIRAIRDAGHDCQQVTKSEAGIGTAEQSLWNATCSGGATYGVVVNRNGTATVVAAR